MKIIDYKILLPTSARQLGWLVRELMKDGWQPLGPALRDETGYYQTMVKYAEYDSPGCQGDLSWNDIYWKEDIDEDIKPTPGIEPPKMARLRDSY